MLRFISLLNVLILLNYFATSQALPCLDAASEAYHKSLILNKGDDLFVDRDQNHATGHQPIFIVSHSPHRFD